jgi:Tfp pilus assembly protein PilN
LTNDVDAEGRLAVVAAMRESDLKTLLADAKAAGFKIERVIPAAFGSMLLAESLGHRDLAVVQDTREGLAIDLLAGGELRYSRVAPMPANPALIDGEISRSFQAVSLSCAPTLAAGGFPYAEAEYKSATHTLEALATTALDRLGINLETQETRDKRQKDLVSKRSRMALLMCAAALVAALYVYFDWSDHAEQADKANAKWNLGLTKLRKETKTLEASMTKLGATSDSLKRAFQPAQTPYDILTTIANHAPKGLWLTGITFERGKIMYIRGTSSTGEAVTAYLQALTSEDRLRDVKLVFATNGEIEKTPVVQFSIQAFPVGNLPLIEQKKGVKKS